MGKSKSKKNLNTDSDTNSETNTQDTQDTQDTQERKKLKQKKNKKNKNSGFIDKFVKLSSRTKTYLAIITMLLIFAGFIWFKQNKKTETNVNQIGNAIQQNLESMKDIGSTNILHLSQNSHLE